MKKNLKAYDQQAIRRKNESDNKPLGRPEHLSARDCKILNYLWRWKVASTASVHEMINRPYSIYSTYKVLAKLERSGFITSQYDYSGQFYVWLLSVEGFSIVKKTLAPLLEDNYLSLDHNVDRFVQAFHLGEWATHQFPNVQFFTLQELQRCHPTDFPEWIPKSREHRPDGYTKIHGATENYVFAFEVELTTKNISKYEAIIHFYKQAKINRVYWLVDSAMTKTQILAAISNAHDDSYNYHAFVDLTEFQQQGWDAWITNEKSEKVHTIRKNMQELCGDKHVFDQMERLSVQKQSLEIDVTSLKEKSFTDKVPICINDYETFRLAIIDLLENEADPQVKTAIIQKIIHKIIINKEEVEIYFFVGEKHYKRELTLIVGSRLDLKCTLPEIELLPEKTHTNPLPVFQRNQKTSEFMYLKPKKIYDAGSNSLHNGGQRRN